MKSECFAAYFLTSSFPQEVHWREAKSLVLGKKIVEWRKKKINRKKHSMCKAKTLIKKAQDSGKQNKTIKMPRRRWKENG